MATIEAINECIQEIKKRGLKQINGTPSHVDLLFFGIERLVGQSDLTALSISEKRRHEREDEMLRCVYTNEQSYPPCIRRNV